MEKFFHSFYVKIKQSALLVFFEKLEWRSFSMLDKIGEFLGISSKRFLGIDIGSSSIRIIELSKKGQSLKLENYGEMNLEGVEKERSALDNLGSKSSKSSDKAIADKISLILKEAEIKEKDAGFSIPDFGSFFTTVDLPEMEEEEIEQALRYQVRPYVPLSLDEVTLDWSVIEGQPGETKIKVLVVAIPNTIIASYKMIVSFTDLNLRFLEPEIFPLARAVGRQIDKKTVALIDVGATSTTCSVMDSGLVKVSHSFNIAGNELTQVVARSLNINYNKAEELKRKEGLLPKSELKSSSGVRELLMPLTSNIVEEVKKALRSFFVAEGREVETVILSGGLSIMPGLRELFAVELKKPVSVIDPFVGIDVPDSLKGILKERAPYYSVAYGLAMKGLQ